MVSSVAVEAKSQADASSARLVVQAWLGTRLLLIITAVVVSLRSGKSVIECFSSWDVAHFVYIAEHGYARQTDQAFFPGLPLVLRFGIVLGLDPVAWGVLVSLVTSALATWALYRLGGRWAAIAWLLAPTSVFTLVPYSESPFCAAAFWAWERARKRKWAAAALLASAACTLRVSGLFLVGALGVMALEQAWRERRVAPLLTSVPWLLLPLGVLFSYALFLYGKTGSWTAWFAAQAAGWEREFTWPWESLANTWRAIQPGMYADHPGWVEVFRAEFAAMIVGVIVVIITLYKKRWAQASWVGVQLLAFSLSYWFQSVIRAILLWFPLWILVGEAVEKRQTGWWRLFWAALAVLAVIVQVIWAQLFYNYRWAG